jgi:hypothetical protein
MPIPPRFLAPIGSLKIPALSSDGRFYTTTEQNSAYFCERDEDGGGEGEGGGPFEILSCLRLSVDIFP